MKRRNVIAGMAAAGAALVAGLHRFTDLFVKHYPPTPYDDVLSRLVGRELAVKLGASVPGKLDPKSLAALLRTSLKSDGLTAAAESDIAADRMTEVEGWLLPQSVALLAALASRV